MRMALDEAARGGAEGNRAVGSVLVREDSVVARGRNLVITSNDPTAHAEMAAIRRAGKTLGDVDYTGCTLYTTFEPCPMCLGAIMDSRISALVMGGRHADAIRRWGNYTVEKLLALARREGSLRVVTGILPEECLKVRQKWEARYAVQE